MPRLNKMIVSAAALAFAATSLPSVVFAAATPLPTSVTISTTQPVLSAAAGNGITQSQTLVGVSSSSATPLVGVGALSGDPQHYGSVASVSLLNTGRLVGVDIGPGGSKSPNTVSITNPSKAPVLSPLAH